MPQACGAAETTLVEGLMSSADCHVGNLVQTGYGALAGENSPLVPILTTLLTLYVAIVGLRLMLGLGRVRVGDLTLSLVKIGVVLALATNWPLYQRLVFDTLFNGPEQLAGGMLKGAGASAGAVHAGLQHAFDEMQAGAQFFAARTPGGVSPWLGGAGFSAAALTVSSVLMLASTVGVLLGLKIVLAVVLLTGPLFLGFFLFQSTRGVFTGWLRAAAALSLAPLFAMLATVLQLQMVQPHLAALATLRAQSGDDPAPAVAILLVTLITGLVALAGLAACGVVGLSIRLPFGGSAGQASQGAAAAPAQLQTDRPPFAAGRIHEPAPRIASVAAAAAAMERRDSRMFVEHAARAAAPMTSPHAADAFTAAPLGRASSSTPRRAARPPVAASSLRRDR